MASELAIPESEHVGTMGLSGLRFTLLICYLNFIVYILMYVTGMYVNIYITSGVSTISIGDPFNIIHMVSATINFAFSFIVMALGFIYGMRRMALYSFGAVAALVVGTVGGLLFLTSGAGRAGGSTTLAGGWIMSFMFMLALFLSYYATLKVVRAIRVIETFSPPRGA